MRIVLCQTVVTLDQLEMNNSLELVELFSINKISLV